MALPAYAQQQVNMRTGEHRGYTRLVFDWPETVTYKIEEEDEKFIINEVVLARFCLPISCHRPLPSYQTA